MFQIVLEKKISKRTI